MDLESYRDKIRLAARERAGAPIYNGSPDHAAIIVEELFLSANSHVRLLSGDLNARVYGAPGVVRRAREFLSHSNHDLRILLERETYSPSHPLIEEMAGQRNVKIAVMPQSIRDALKYHFMTADEDCFRFEPEKELHVAVAAFGDRPTTGNLNEIFETIWDLSEQRPVAAFAE
ncbi:MAG TPA: hypothetical protein VF655_10020 [Allosphingosinicella sp.]|jgi:hypothetical protein